MDANALPRMAKLQYNVYDMFVFLLQTRLLIAKQKDFFMFPTNRLLRLAQTPTLVVW